jgi:hypothetical protein
MVVTKSKGSFNKSENISKKPKSANNTSVDKHKMWLIAGITFVILAVVFLVLFPAIKEGVAGKAIAGVPVGEELSLLPVHDNTGIMTSNFQVPDPLSKINKMNTYVLFTGKDNNGNSVNEICLCGSIGSHGFSCPSYEVCTTPPEEAVTEINTELVAALTKSSTVQKKADLINLRKKATDIVTHLETQEEEAEDNPAIDLVEVATALEEIQTVKKSIDINLAAFGGFTGSGGSSTSSTSSTSSGSSTTDTSSSSTTIDCTNDNPTVAYSAENAPDNVCGSTVLLVGNGLGNRFELDVKSLTIGGATKTSYTTGTKACQDQLNSGCMSIEKYENGNWATTVDNYPSCGNVINSVSYDLNGIYRAKCGQVTFGIGSSSSSSGGVTVTTSGGTLKGGAPR